MPGHLTARQPAGLTGIRQEVKYLLNAKDGIRARQLIGQKVPAKIFEGSSMSYRISIYLDAHDNEMALRAIKNGSQTTKLRVKEYYQMKDNQPQAAGKCWLEVKVRYGTMVEKSRFELNTDQVEQTIIHGPGQGSTPKDQAAREAFEAIREGRPLSPLFIAHYRRWTFQGPNADLRITFDNEVSYHVPPANLFSKKIPVCARMYLPPPLKAEQSWIVEVKSTGPGPLWIEDVLGSQTVEYSKFGTGVKALADRGLLTQAQAPKG